MKSLTNICGSLPSPSLMLHYLLIALFLASMGAGVVWYSHVEKVMATVDTNAKQVTGLADSLRGELPDHPELDAKLTRIQVKSGQIQSTVQSVVPNTTAVN